MAALVDVLTAHQRQEKWFGQHDGWWECTCMLPEGPTVPWSPAHQAEMVAAAGLVVVELPEPVEAGGWRVMSDVVIRAKAALEGVTTGPWVFDDHDDSRNDFITVGAGTYLNSPGHYTSTDLIYEVDTFGIEVDSEDYAQITADAQFVAAARTLIPVLVAEVERLRGVLLELANG